MNRKTLTLLSIVVMVLTAGVIGIAVATQQHSSVVSCNPSGAHTHFDITIQGDTVHPTRISGHLCDTLTITNKDNVTREIAFGPHEDHVPYDGVKERALQQNQSLAITLDQVGTFYFHDHDHDEVTGSFSVRH